MLWYSEIAAYMGAPQRVNGRSVVRYLALIAIMAILASGRVEAQQLLNQWLDAGCSVVSAQVTAEVAVVLNCKPMVETRRKSGKDFKGASVPPEFAKNYGYTVVCVTDKIQPGTLGLNVRYCLTIP